MKPDYQYILDHHQEQTEEQLAAGAKMDILLVQMFLLSRRKKAFVTPPPSAPQPSAAPIPAASSPRAKRPAPLSRNAEFDQAMDELNLAHIRRFCFEHTNERLREDLDIGTERLHEYLTYLGFVGTELDFRIVRAERFPKRPIKRPKEWARLQQSSSPADKVRVIETTGSHIQVGK